MTHKDIRHATFTALACLATILPYGCSEKVSVPRQPDFIVVNLAEPFSAEVGETFELSIPAQEDASDYLWIVPEAINIVEGNGTPEILATGLVSGVIKAGSIMVYAVNPTGESIPRVLYKEITIKPMPEKPGFIKCSIEGSMTAFYGERVRFSIDEDDALESVLWTVPDDLSLSGGGTSSNSIEFTAPSDTRILVRKGEIGVNVTYKTGVTQSYVWEKDIRTADPEGAKRYGKKIWMTKNLTYAGEDGNVGRVYPGDDDGSTYGRYYTWSEAMTGKADGNNPYTYGSSGKDDEGNEYSLTNGLASFNIQIQGICPEGWHIPNAYDFYDLAVGVAQDYGLEVKSINDCVSLKAGIYLPDNRETNPMKAMNMIEYGFISSYLRGSRPAAEGGMWAEHASAVDNGTMFSLSKASGVFPADKYPMYFDIASSIGFNILPCGQYNGDTLPALGTYSFHWTATVTSENKSYRFTVGNNSCNLSTYAQAQTYGCNVRCVANY